ncbi:MAG: DUF4845 domain-containing protein [Burkholderiales bacterium]
MHKQKGLTLTGMIVASILVVFLILLAFRVVPVYIEYNTIQKQFRGMAEDPSLRGARRSDVERAWAARATVDNITSVTGDNMTLEREGDRWVISADYSVKVPVVYNVSLCIDFHPSSRQ